MLRKDNGITTLLSILVLTIITTQSAHGMIRKSATSLMAAMCRIKDAHRYEGTLSKWTDAHHDERTLSRWSFSVNNLYWQELGTDHILMQSSQSLYQRLQNQTSIKAVTPYIEYRHYSGGTSIQTGNLVEWSTYSIKLAECPYGFFLWKSDFDKAIEQFYADDEKVRTTPETYIRRQIPMLCIKMSDANSSKEDTKIDYSVIQRSRDFVTSRATSDHDEKLITPNFFERYLSRKE